MTGSVLIRPRVRPITISPGPAPHARGKMRPGVPRVSEKIGRGGSLPTPLPPLNQTPAGTHTNFHGVDHKIVRSGRFRKRDQFRNREGGSGPTSPSWGWGGSLRFKNTGWGGYRSTPLRITGPAGFFASIHGTFRFGSLTERGNSGLVRIHGR